MNTARGQVEDLDSIANKIKEGIKSGKYTLTELQGAVMEHAKEAARTTDHYVRENPWTVVGIAVGVGLAIGLIIPRR